MRNINHTFSVFSVLIIIYLFIKNACGIGTENLVFFKPLKRWWIAQGYWYLSLLQGVLRWAEGNCWVELGCKLTYVFCCPWSRGCSQWNAITRRWQFRQNTLEPPWLRPASDCLKLAVMWRVIRHWDWCQRPAWLLRAPPCPGLRDTEAALAADPSSSSVLSVKFCRCFDCLQLVLAAFCWSLIQFAFGNTREKICCFY